MAMQSPSLICIMLLSIALTVAGHPRGCEMGTKETCRLIGGVCRGEEEECNGKVYPGKIFCHRPGRCVCCTPIRPPKGCVFGQTSYPSGAFLEESCLQLQCIDGTWIDKDVKDIANCGKCEVYGDPHFITFDNHTGRVHEPGNGKAYVFQQIGTYTITQDGLDFGSTYGVTSEFVACNDPFNPLVTCVSSATYYEPGLKVEVILSGTCEIEVIVNGAQQHIGNSVTYITNLAGSVLVFPNIYDASNPDIQCINVVGSKGVSITVCQNDCDYTFLHVWVTPSLKNQVYGLCDKFTGLPDEYYTLRNGSEIVGATQAGIDDFADSWALLTYFGTTPVPFIEDRCTNNDTALHEMEVLCADAILPSAYPIWKSELFNVACVFDLCHVQDPDRYVRGYNSHIRFCTREGH